MEPAAYFIGPCFVHQTLAGSKMALSPCSKGATLLLAHQQAALRSWMASMWPQKHAFVGIKPTSRRALKTGTRAAKNSLTFKQLGGNPVGAPQPVALSGQFYNRFGPVPCHSVKTSRPLVFYLDFRQHRIHWQKMRIGGRGRHPNRPAPPQLVVEDGSGGRVRYSIFYR